MSQSSYRPSEAKMTVQISFTVEASYRNRGAFPGLRLERATRRSGSVMFFEVPLSFAREVLKDAQHQIVEIGSGRGLYQGYRALARHIQRDLDAVEGVQEDPGLEQVKSELNAIGTHSENTTVYDGSGRPVIIRHAYALRRCNEDDGPYRDRSGTRFAYRPGYVGTVITTEGPVAAFFSAGDLFDAQGRPTHLCLVYPR